MDQSWVCVKTRSTEMLTAMPKSRSGPGMSRGRVSVRYREEKVRDASDPPSDQTWWIQSSSSLPEKR